jgi:hypothetical protein
MHAAKSERVATAERPRRTKRAAVDDRMITSMEREFEKHESHIDFDVALEYFRTRSIS